MPTKVFESLIDATVDEVWGFHCRPDALRSLTPPGRKVGWVSKDNTLKNGALHVMRIRHFGMPLIWEARISEVDPPHGFVDTAEMAPFKVWVHKHEFIEKGKQTLLRDTVTYEALFGPLGWLLRMIWVDRTIKNLFAFRHEQTQKLIEQYRAESGSPEHELVKADH